MSSRPFLPAFAVLLAIGAASAEARPSIAITFDDLPAHGALPPGTTRLAIIGDIVTALKAARVGEVYGFVNGVLTERENDLPVLQSWRDAGLPIGNHGWSHLNLDDVGSSVASADIIRNEPLVAALAGNTDWHWYRYPYLAEGRDPATRLALRHDLTARGYRIAAVTMSFDDYLWNPPYARCLETHDASAIAHLEASYLTAATNAAAEARVNAQALYGRDIPYVLLMHAGAFDARMLPRLLALYHRQGFAFTTLAKAEADLAYAADVDPSLPPVATIRDRLLAAGKTPAPRADIAPDLAAVCPAGPG